MPLIRSILHLDLDAFYASVEQLDDPQLQGRPVIVGGTSGRGVVSAASYEARTFGVRSAMPMARALQLCPQAAVCPVRMARYRELSRQVFAIFGRYTDLVEPLSIDEAFLDVGGSRSLFGPAAVIARRIRQEVRAETGLIVSAGIAPNKFLAKLASESAKPDGVLEVTADGVDAFLLPLPVERLWGVGPQTASQLQRLGVATVADLRRWPVEHLQRQFGKLGSHLYRLSRGEDDRPVMPRQPLKSIGHEDTYPQDLHGLEACHRALLDLAERVAVRLRRHGVEGRVLSLKVRYGGFETVSRQKVLAHPTSHAPTLYREAQELLARTEADRRPVRLLGMSLSGWENEGGTLELFSQQERGEEKALDAALDRLRERFGAQGIKRGSLLETEDP